MLAGVFGVWGCYKAAAGRSLIGWRIGFFGTWCSLVALGGFTGILDFCVEDCATDYVHGNTTIWIDMGYIGIYCSSCKKKCRRELRSWWVFGVILAVVVENKCTLHTW